MLKVIPHFIVLFACFFLGINLLRNLTGKEAWRLTKLFTYSLVCAILSIAVMFGIVILF